MSTVAASPTYELLYHPQIPGRGEFVRLAFEAAGVKYTDVANESEHGYSRVQKICMNQGLESGDGNPPIFAPPALRISGLSDNQAPLIIAQTPNILLYLGEKLRLFPDSEAGKHHAFQLVLTALDLNNEMHDTHHPIASAKYYDDQKTEALKKAADVREIRFPKFFSYFERTLQHNNDGERDRIANGGYLIGRQLSLADLVVWQVIDGSFFAFPNEMAARKVEFPTLLDLFYNNIKEEPRLRQYLTSERRRAYGMGVFRHYPELDRQI